MHCMHVRARARAHTHTHTHAHTHALHAHMCTHACIACMYEHTHTRTYARTHAHILSLVVIFFALCLLLLTWSIAGVACRACHSSGTFFHCDTHTRMHAMQVSAWTHLSSCCSQFLGCFFLSNSFQAFSIDLPKQCPGRRFYYAYNTGDLNDVTTRVAEVNWQRKVEEVAWRRPGMPENTKQRTDCIPMGGGGGRGRGALFSCRKKVTVCVSLLKCQHTLVCLTTHYVLLCSE